MATPSPMLVIGRSGQVASALRRLAPALLPQRPLLLAARPELDLAAPAPELAPTVEKLLEQHQPALVLNAAAYTAVDKAESESQLATAINEAAVGVLARACAARSLPLFHLSTDYVFAGDGERPWREDDPTGPLSVYGASKLAGEKVLRAAGGPHLLLRVSWVFGVEGANFVRRMLRLGAERPALSVVADQIGGPTSAEAIASTWLSLAEAAVANRSPLDPDQPFPWGTYHYAGEPAVSWYSFAEAIFAEAVALGLLARAPDLTPIPTSAYPTPAQRPANSRMETSRFRSAFDIPPPDWREDLRTCLRAWA